MYVQQLAGFAGADLTRCFLNDSILYCGSFAKYVETFLGNRSRFSTLVLVGSAAAIHAPMRWILLLRTCL